LKPDDVVSVDCAAAASGVASTVTPTTAAAAVSFLTNDTEPSLSG